MSALSPNLRLWNSTLSEFQACHRRSLNVLLHGLTTPAGVYATLVLLGVLHPAAPLALGLLFCSSLVGRLPAALWWATAGLTGALVLAAWLIPVGPLGALLLLVLSYGLQELAHHLTDEPTMQSGYMGRRGWRQQLVVHTWLLLPLVLAALRRVSPLRWLVASDRVVSAHLGDGYSSEIERLTHWIHDQDPSTEHTTHWWRLDLPAEPLAAFDALADSDRLRQMFRGAFGQDYCVERVTGMDEVYVAGPDQHLTSDAVFYMSHIDGPVCVWPFAAVYRCVLALSPNQRISTHFPMRSVDDEGFVLSTGDVVGFDFNRELHYIRCDDSAPHTGQRLVLKLHYLVRPRFLPRYGRLLGRVTTRYNVIARDVFLDTLTPKTLRARLGAAWVVATTRSWQELTRWVGATNLAWVLLLGLLSLALRSPLPLLIGASFVHYLIYIATFHHRDQVSYRTFVRDAVFFKLVSYAQLAFWGVALFEPDPLAILMILGGFGLSGLAAWRLGPVRTWFGAELGQLPPTRVTGFPYGRLPHPMILGAVVGLVGL
ncbi:MAG: hypothetical protein H6741_34590, partial [Alphaproteobacteria bacterium]|nr:hypothetical protein [Alphaproteobacteria bacterium]